MLEIASGEAAAGWVLCDGKAKSPIELFTFTEFELENARVAGENELHGSMGLDFPRADI